MKLRRGLSAAVAVVVALVVAPSAQAAITSVYGGAAECVAQPANGNIRLCTGVTLTWDHATKINFNLFLPPATGGTEGPYPTIGDFHGWGAAKLGLNQVPPAAGESPGGFIESKDPRIQGWAEHGYAVFSMSDRGWGFSCGKFDPERAQEQKEKEEQENEGKGPPKIESCKQGYNHLMDDRYEVRDAQFLISELADEGVVEPKKVGTTGVSYGGGLSMALAALRNREMLPGGELVPWRSPGGMEMEIAAAVPQWPWSDLAYALAPNGRNLDYVTESSYRGPFGNYPVGVWKASWSEYFYQVGLLLSNYDEGDPQADIPGWTTRLKAGEPYTDSTINGIVQQLSTFHSSFGIEHSVEPSPLLIQSGWNDDLFPVDEALRFYQRTRAQYPSDPISLYLADVAAFNARLEAWFAHYLKGEGAAPNSSVEATTTTCPNSAPSEGPYRADDWSGLAPGEIRFGPAAAQKIEPGTGAETESSKTFDPIVGPKIGKDACSTVPGTDEPGIANYRLAATPAGGFTLMGSPTIIAQIQAPSPNSEIAARLLDVSPEGNESLIARGLYRPTGGSQQIVFQLHPQGYHFAAGHVAKLELLPSDFPYGRFSNLQTPITVSSLELRLPVVEQPGSLDGLVQKPLPKVVPAGYKLAAEYEEPAPPAAGGKVVTPSPRPPAPPIKIGAGGLAGKFTANRKAVVVPVRCSGEGACTGQISVTVKRPGGKGRANLAQGRYSLARNTTTNVRLPLTKGGRNIVKSRLAKGRGSATLAGMVQLTDPGRPTSLTLKRTVHLSRGH